MNHPVMTANTLSSCDPTQETDYQESTTSIATKSQASQQSDNSKERTARRLKDSIRLRCSKVTLWDRTQTGVIFTLSVEKVLPHFSVSEMCLQNLWSLGIGLEPQSSIKGYMIGSASGNQTPQTSIEYDLHECRWITRCPSKVHQEGDFMVKVLPQQLYDKNRVVSSDLLFLSNPETLELFSQTYYKDAKYLSKYRSARKESKEESSNSSSSSSVQSIYKTSPELRPQNFYGCTMVFNSDQSGQKLLLKAYMFYPEITFSFMPIAPIKVVSTPLTRTLTKKQKSSMSVVQAGSAIHNNEVPHIPATPKVISGFLTLDQSRRVLPLLCSDNMAFQYALVGVWISGIFTKDFPSKSSSSSSENAKYDFVKHPSVWAACMRYIQCPDIKQRVSPNPSKNTFLVIVFRNEKTPLFLEVFTEKSGESRSGDQPKWMFRKIEQEICKQPGVVFPRVGFSFTCQGGDSGVYNVEQVLDEGKQLQQFNEEMRKQAELEKSLNPESVETSSGNAEELEAISDFEDLRSRASTVSRRSGVRNYNPSHDNGQDQKKLERRDSLGGFSNHDDGHQHQRRDMFDDNVHHQSYSSSTAGMPRDQKLKFESSGIGSYNAGRGRLDRRSRNMTVTGVSGLRQPSPSAGFDNAQTLGVESVNRKSVGMGGGPGNSMEIPGDTYLRRNRSRGGSYAGSNAGSGTGSAIADEVIKQQSQQLHMLQQQIQELQAHIFNQSKQGNVSMNQSRRSLNTYNSDVEASLDDGVPHNNRSFANNSGSQFERSPMNRNGGRGAERVGTVGSGVSGAGGRKPVRRLNENDPESSYYNPQLNNSKYQMKPSPKMRRYYSNSPCGGGINTNQATSSIKKPPRINPRTGQEYEPTAMVSSFSPGGKMIRPVVSTGNQAYLTSAQDFPRKSSNSIDSLGDEDISRRTGRMYQSFDRPQAVVGGGNPTLTNGVHNTASTSYHQYHQRTPESNSQDFSHITNAPQTSGHQHSKSTIINRANSIQDFENLMTNPQHTLNQQVTRSPLHEIDVLNTSNPRRGEYNAARYTTPTNDSTGTGGGGGVRDEVGDFAVVEHEKSGVCVAVDGGDGNDDLVFAMGKTSGHQMSNFTFQKENDGVGLECGLQETARFDKELKRSALGNAVLEKLKSVTQGSSGDQSTLTGGDNPTNVTNLVEKSVTDENKLAEDLTFKPSSMKKLAEFSIDVPRIQYNPVVESDGDDDDEDFLGIRDNELRVQEVRLECENPRYMR